MWWFKDTACFADAVHMLNPAEIQRASAYLFEVDRRRFVARRSVVKYLLAALHACKPSEVVLSVNAYGKPVIATSPYIFNTSSCANSLLVAVGRRCEIAEIGVDLELIRCMPDALLIAQNFFSADEVAQLCALSSEKRLQAFFNCWTRKEALVKAFGSGLSFDLNRFSVTMLPDEPAKILQIDGQASNWQLHAWSPTQHHVAALATQFAADEVRMHFDSTDCMHQWQNLNCDSV